MSKHTKQLIDNSYQLSNYIGCNCCHLTNYQIDIPEDIKVEDNKLTNAFQLTALECGRRLPQIGDVYNHFKGMKIYIVDLAYHTETNEPLVVYKHENTTWARPLKMFLSKVDKEKYPDVKQYYRLERELPLNIKDTIEFKELVFDLIYNVDKFGNMKLSEVEEYVLRHYYL